MSGKYRGLWKCSDGTALLLKFQSDLGESAFGVAALEQERKVVAMNAVSDERYQIVPSRYEPLLIKFFSAVKKNPSLTLAQFNSYVSQNFNWQEQALLNKLVVDMVDMLSEKYGLNSSGYTQSQCWIAVRNFIVVKDVEILVSKLIQSD